MELSRHQLRLHQALATTWGQIEQRDSLLIRHQHGLGEASPLPAYGGEDLGTCQQALARIDDDACQTWLAQQNPWAPWPQELPAVARFGLLSALVDALAKSHDRPLHRLYGAKQDRIPIVQLQALHQPRLPLGACSKFKAEADPASTLRVLQALPKQGQWRIDVNGAWDPDQSRWFWQHACRLPIAYLEQPLAPGQLNEHARLRAEGCRIALDEDLRSLSDAHAIIATEAADVLIVKPALLGGPDRCHALQQHTRLPLVFSTLLDGAVARRQVAALALSLGGTLPQGLGTGQLLATDLPLPADPIHDDHWQASGAGIGMAWP
jgi:L-Ala-D/L-Glu epimerase